MLWSELVVRKFYSLLMSKTPEAVELEKQALLAGFEEMVPYFCRDGNFFSSHGFSMFECSALPWFQRLPVLRKYRGFALPDGEPYRRLTAWYEACLAVPCFARTVVDETRLVQCYVGYANGTGTSNCAQLTKGLNGDYAYGTLDRAPACGPRGSPGRYPSGGFTDEFDPHPRWIPIILTPVDYGFCGGPTEPWTPPTRRGERPPASRT
eukprot:CAMPEP_0113714270 /NCGR_PEP_ID=MMETSP0038_2-20120614/32503_1 /TAXON_ID=2898 /ORGANISM="Cryptomonas paramecium" /LENGTH=207 /DNA_ID=CAMNT_0000641187 /DNA_START=674 /DNA_END=1294 /DNA_ORIENTATION=+ /assembly_acc=CAM_ASM_000170